MNIVCHSYITRNRPCSSDFKLYSQNETFFLRFNDAQCCNGAKKPTMLGRAIGEFGRIYKTQYLLTFQRVAHHPLALSRKDRSKLIIPCYRDMDAYELPEELSYLQSRDMGKIGFIQDLIRGIKKVISNLTNTGRAPSPSVIR